MAIARRLYDLKIAELNEELEERKLSTAGKKYELQARLYEKMLEEGKNSDYELETTASLQTKQLENSEKLEGKL